MIAPPATADQPVWDAVRDGDPVVRRYRTLFALLDWQQVPERDPRGDPACRLGVKRSTNQERPDGSPTVRKADVWGYRTGLVSATDSRDGDVVLAESTQPFNAADVTYDHPLQQPAVATLGKPPTHVAADAAFDAWHVDQTCAPGGGIAAIPRNRRGQPPPERDEPGRPRCAKGLAMVPRARFTHEDGDRALRHGCPPRFPVPTGQLCEDAHFRQGHGGSTAITLAPGGQMRATLDRQADAFKASYRQRTSAERINSQATALGIERPKVRNANSVHRLNALPSLVSNARALQRARRLNAAPAPHRACC